MKQERGTTWDTASEGNIVIGGEMSLCQEKLSKNVYEF